MKLSQDQVDQIRDKTGFTPLPDEAAAQSGLAGHFGEDTFYLDPNGVYVFEETEQASGRQGKALTAFQIAAVEGTAEEGEEDVTIRGIEPKATALTVDLD